MADKEIKDLQDISSDITSAELSTSKILLQETSDNSYGSVTLEKIKSILCGGDQDAPTASSIRDSLQTLTGENRLPASAVKDIPEGGGGGIIKFVSTETYTHDPASPKYFDHEGILYKQILTYKNGDNFTEKFKNFPGGTVYDDSTRARIIVQELRSITDVQWDGNYIVYKNTSGGLTRILLTSGTITEYANISDVLHFGLEGPILFVLKTTGVIERYWVNQSPSTAVATTYEYTVPRPSDVVSFYSDSSNYRAYWLDNVGTIHFLPEGASSPTSMAVNAVEMTPIMDQYFAWRTATGVHVQGSGSTTPATSRLDITGQNISQLGYSRSYGSYCVFALTAEGNLLSNIASANFSDGDITCIDASVYGRLYLGKADGIYNVVAGEQTKIATKDKVQAIVSSKSRGYDDKVLFTTEADGLEYVGDIGQGVKTDPTALLNTTASALTQKIVSGLSAVGTNDRTLVEQVAQNTADVLGLQDSSTKVYLRARKSSLPLSQHFTISLFSRSPSIQRNVGVEIDGSSGAITLPAGDYTAHYHVKSGEDLTLQVGVEVGSAESGSRKHNLLAGNSVCGSIGFSVGEGELTHWNYIQSSVSGSASVEVDLEIIKV